jgi:uncharacterized membrane protein
MTFGYHMTNFHLQPMKRQKADESHDDQQSILVTNDTNQCRPFIDVELEGKRKDTMPAVVADTHTRSILKGLTWRVVASCTTMSIAWYITGTIKVALEIGFIEFFAKVVIYYAHERMWANIRV